MGIDRLTKLFDADYLEEPLEIELARAERYGRELGFVLLEPVFATQGSDLTYAALKKLAVMALAQTRRVDVRIRWQNTILLIMPETPKAGLEVVVKKIEEAFSTMSFEDSRGNTLFGKLRHAITTFGEFDSEASEFPGNINKRKLLLDTLMQRLSATAPA